MIVREQVYEDTYREYASRVRGYLYNRIDNREDADELFQDIFTAFWRALEKFRGEAKPSTLLFTITYRCRANYIRKRYTRIFARSDEKYIQHFSEKLDYRINALLHPMWSKHLNEEQRELVLAIKRTRENQNRIMRES